SHFLVMEFVEGANLDEAARAQGRLPAWQACDYARQVALGLQHAFERGMVHRDIKPHNLMVTGDGQGKILDLALARVAPETVGAERGPAAPWPSRPASEQTTLWFAPALEAGDPAAAFLVEGTPDYMAPEEARDPARADIRADVY